MAIYPHTIDNGAGERLTFVRRRGDRLEVENSIRPGGGPPMHLHTWQTETLTVQQGRLGYQRLGQEPAFAGEGETVVFPAGEAHRFWNAGDGELRCTGFITPIDYIEYFLSALYDSQRRSGGKRPNPFEVAFLMRRYRSEFAMVEVPALVRRVVFPVLVTIGRLLGRYDRYADAPRPVRR
jgi:quercetin dioxygenase-like cupin family protein